MLVSLSGFTVELMACDAGKCSELFLFTDPGVVRVCPDRYPHLHIVLYYPVMLRIPRISSHYVGRTVKGRIQVFKKKKKKGGGACY